MANLVTSPQPGADAGEMGRPKISSAWWPARRVPTTQGAHSNAATPQATAAAASTRPICSPLHHQGRTEGHRHRATQRHRQDGGANDVAAAMMAPEHGDLSGRPARQPRPTTWSKGAMPATRARRATMKGRAA